jgi:hypothetical protein
MVCVSVWRDVVCVCVFACVHVGQVKALTYGKIMSMNLNAIDFWID